MIVLPKLLVDRTSITQNYMEPDGKHFLAQITIGEGSELIGLQSKSGIFGAYPDMTLRVIERSDEAYLPPFEDVPMVATALAPPPAPPPFQEPPPEPVPVPQPAYPSTGE